MDSNDQMKYFFRIFTPSLPRLGPGDNRLTLEALQRLRSANPFNDSGRIRILDIGCGNGTQTIQLAKKLDCTILAVDNHQPFLDELMRRGG